MILGDRPELAFPPDPAKRLVIRIVECAPRPMKPVTHKEIAAALGVHTSTVSLALRSDPRLPAATRQRVLEMAKKLGYRPNPLVTALMEQRRKQVAKHVAATLAFVPLRREPEAFRQSTSELLYFQGFEHRAGELGFRVEEIAGKRPHLTFRRLAGILRSRGIRGVAFGVNEVPRGHLPMDLEGLASVAHGYSVLRPLLHRVTHDHCNGILLACREMRRIGYRRIGYVAYGPVDDVVNNQWLGGFSIYNERQTARNRVPPLLLKRYHQEPFLAWFRRHRPDAIVSIAHHVMEWLRAAGVEVPGACGYAHLDITPLDSVPWAGIDQQSEKLGRVAAEILANQLVHNEYGKPSIPTLTLIEGCWRPGSTLPPKPA